MTKQNQGSFKTKKIPFTQVCNMIAQNDDLSHSAKGLYLLIQSHITNPYLKVTKNFLMKHSKEGRRAFDSSWNELKKTGFLKQYIKRNENNQFIYEYDLLDEPVIEDENAAEVAVETPPYVQNDTPETIHSPYTRFATTENVLTQNDTINNKTNFDNTDSNNTFTNETEIFICSDNPILSYHTDIEIDTDGYEKIKRLKKAPVTKEKQEENNSIIAENISLNVLLLKYPSKTEQINEIYNLMCDTVNSSKTIFRISGENKPIYGIRRAFFSLNEEHIEYIMDSLDKNTTKIINYKAYLLTTIYNSYFTYSNAIGLSFNHAFKDTMFVKQ